MDDARLPVRFRDRTPSEQLVVAVAAPLLFGAVAGLALAIAAGAYYAVALLGVAGGLVAGLEHDDARSAAGRGVVAGAAFAAGVLVVDAIASGAPKADLPDPAVLLVPVSALVTAALAQPGAWRRRRLAAPARVGGR